MKVIITIFFTALALMSIFFMAEHFPWTVPFSGGVIGGLTGLIVYFVWLSKWK